MISIIAGVRLYEDLEREPYLLRNFLYSLKHQTKSPLEIIISDFGSEPIYRDKIEEYCKKYKAKYIFTDTNEVWNRPKALNIGIKNSSNKSKYIICTDIDMLFRKDFVETISNFHKNNENAFILSQFSDLDENAIKKDTDVVKNFEYLASIAIPHCSWRRHLVAKHKECAQCTGVGYGIDYCSKLNYTTRQMQKPRLTSGACQSASRDWFFKVRGYDERFTGWGGNDTDMRYRAQKDGLKEIWIQGETILLHQWHPKQIELAKKKGNLKNFLEKVKKNRHRRDNLNTVVRNKDFEWGSRETV